MNTNQPLEEFEFQQAAEIRKPEPPPRPRRFKNPPVANWLVWALVCTAIALAALTWYLIDQLRQTQALVQTITQSRDMAVQESRALKMEMDTANRMLEQLNQKLNTSSKGKEQLLETIGSLRDQLNAAAGKRKAAERDRDRMRTRLKNVQVELKRTRKELDEWKARVKQLNNEKDELTAQLDQARDGIDRLQRELATLRGSMTREGEASRKIAGELLRKEKEIRRLTDQVNRLRQEVAEAKKNLDTLQRVDEGDLVPLSDRVTPAVPLVHPPVRIEKKGLFSKVRGFVMVNVLIDEVGLVRNAVFLEHHLEHADQPSVIISRALAQVMKWKFSPALYDGDTRVRVWQTVAVPVTTE